MSDNHIVVPPHFYVLAPTRQHVEEWAREHEVAWDQVTHVREQRQLAGVRLDMQNMLIELDNWEVSMGSKEYYAVLWRVRTLQQKQWRRDGGMDDG